MKENTIRHRSAVCLLGLLGTLLVSTPVCEAQAPLGGVQPASVLFAEFDLPDAPSATLLSSSLREATDAQAAPALTAPASQIAPKYAIKIKAGETAVRLSAADKFQMGLRQQLSLGSFASVVGSAGFNHVTDGRPHYGTDSPAFGERVGAAALRLTSQSVLNYGVFSNVFHDDPRYYVLGPQYTFKHRVIYAATRIVVTRKDNGSQAPNWALMSAIASSTALTNAYYPERDRNVERSITGALTSLATRAATQQLREFSVEIRQRLHLKH